MGRWVRTTWGTGCSRPFHRTWGSGAVISSVVKGKGPANACLFFGLCCEPDSRMAEVVEEAGWEAIRTVACVSMAQSQAALRFLSAAAWYFAKRCLQVGGQGGRRGLRNIRGELGNVGRGGIGPGLRSHRSHRAGGGRPAPEAFFRACGFSVVDPPAAAEGAGGSEAEGDTTRRRLLRLRLR